MDAPLYAAYDSSATAIRHPLVRPRARARAILAPLRLQNPDLYNHFIWSSAGGPSRAAVHPAVPWSSAPGGGGGARHAHGQVPRPHSRPLFACAHGRRVCQCLHDGRSGPGRKHALQGPLFSWPFTKPAPIPVAPRVPATVKKTSHVTVLTTLFTSTPLCPICLDTLRTPGSILRALPCTHVFHVQCMDTWLVGWRGVCPVRRRDLTRGNQQDDVDVENGDGAEVARSNAERSRSHSGGAPSFFSRIMSWFTRGGAVVSRTESAGHSLQMLQTDATSSTTLSSSADVVALDIDVDEAGAVGGTSESTQLAAVTNNDDGGLELAAAPHPDSGIDERDLGQRHPPHSTPSTVLLLRSFLPADALPAPPPRLADRQPPRWKVGARAVCDGESLPPPFSHS
ncbi:hypothetical protein M427DRAFT_32112 [Gonapodya prolifera JEL478]|uniref:RING-type domain-containing protein n=1 Tax=Gonapodya prolifera (strain JEL478) TaxID=1344416 RepID=A0A139AFW8_GONPJ|nr:hypothetical protein M427DRAFT_32112 [Gonapodya prolifera JEL478]|eukprot:KXS15687.1 hypothetical protein M427DRAFT_32112 [Gonapodya prolifera JEL478]